MSKWFVVHDLEAYEENPRLLGFRERTNSQGVPIIDGNGNTIPVYNNISKFEVDDIVIYYCKKSYIIKGAYRITKICDEIFKPWAESPFQFEIKPLLELSCGLVIRKLINELELFQNVDNKKWGQAIRGANSVRELSDKDYTTFMEYLKKAVNKECRAYETSSQLKNNIELYKKYYLLTEPKLTGGYTYQTKKVSSMHRDAIFRKAVKDIYNSKCAVCGLGLIAPTGEVEVESAHIYPKSLDGSDDIRNGICLCKLHHWALDVGLIAFADDYTIMVKDDIVSDKSFDIISKWKGSKIMLPKDVKFAPHKLYLQANRKLFGF